MNNLVDVTCHSNLWEADDPVRPELSAKFKQEIGRKVIGLENQNGTYDAFLCFALTSSVPSTTDELAEYTDPNGSICVPYTVWSNKPGSGRKIINELIVYVRQFPNVNRIVTLSPQTTMARRFHLRNSAVEYRNNSSSVNFEYMIDSRD